MNELMNFLPAGRWRRNRLLLVGAVILLFLTLAYCHIQKPATDLKPAVGTSTAISTTDGGSDQDGDGVAGDLDACPEQAGAALDNGCPVDTDGDGIADLDDPCPTEAGNGEGCPADRDKDGVTDPEDACPDNAGTANNQGCPTDSDGDGVADANDQCPQTSGLAALNGCTAELEAGNNADETTDLAGSDVAVEPSASGNSPAGSDDNADGDKDAQSAAGHGGANEEESLDSGAATSGGKSDAATSDADGDGLTGASDQCPQQFGNTADNGCPPDSDGDGVADIDDKCPKTAGVSAYDGCSTESGERINPLGLEDQKILDDAVAQVAFDSNSATLTTDSRDLLTAVAGLMQKYPAAKLEIRGHTDASGVADNNMQLSMARARSAAAFIVSVGIDVNRIRAFSFGESQPVADNSSAEGRRLNRRVEFELLFDE